MLLEPAHDADVREAARAAAAEGDADARAGCRVLIAGPHVRDREGQQAESGSDPEMQRIDGVHVRILWIAIQQRQGGDAVVIVEYFPPQHQRTTSLYS